MLQDWKFYIVLALLAAGVYYGYINVNSDKIGVELPFGDDGQPVEDTVETTEDTNPDSSLTGDIMTITFIDVLQGEATLVEFPGGKKMLIDCGPYGEKDKLSAYLRQRGIDMLDFLVVTHPDDDHYGGCPQIMDDIYVRQVYENGVIKDTELYDSYISFAKKNMYRVIHKNMEISMDKFAKAIIYVPYDPRGYSDDDDANSLVIMLKYGDTKILITGDCSRECEDVILPDLEKVNILQLSNGGDSAGNTGLFLDQTQPTEAIISYAEFNTEGQPSEVVIDRLNKEGIHIRRIPDLGHIEVKCDGINCEFQADK